MAFERIWHKSYVEGVPAEIEFEKTTLPEALSRSAREFPDHTALIFMGREITYRELDELVNRFARELLSLGVKPGDTVGLLLPNVPQTVIATYAALRIGAVTSPNNPLYTERELTHQLTDSRASVLVCLDVLLPRVRNVIGKTGVKHVVACHVNDYLPFPKKQLFPFVKKDMYRKVASGDNASEFLACIKRQSGDPVENQAKWDETATLLYTGGTTGVSKGVMLTHANLSSNVQQIQPWFAGFKKGEERFIGIFPFFHAAGFTNLQNLCIWMGWCDILVPRPEPGVIIEMIDKFKPTVIPGVPTIYVGLLADPAFHKLDFSSVKGFFAGAAPLNRSTIDQLEKLTGATICEVYGLTETSPDATASPYGGKVKVGTVGLPLPSTDIKIVDVEDGTKEMQVGEPGEICIKGPQVMAGYYNRPEATAEVLRDGWLHTGDVGQFDEDGYITIVDRKKDMIIAGGYNIYPKEVDEILHAHPKIAEACTVGVPDEYRGETVKAFVVAREGEILTVEEVTAHCRENLAAYKVPKQIEFVEELPKSAVGKILRRVLRDAEQGK
ncbi:MAG: long-chain-fatty-acid--CoA ligase [Desulfatibacillaceae bacterium]